MLAILASLILGLAYVLLYSFASFLFSYKIYLVSNDKYNTAAVASGAGLFINFSMYAIIPYVVIATTFWWISIILLVALVIGAFLSTAVMSKVDFFHMKDKEEVKEVD